MHVNYTAIRSIQSAHIVSALVLDSTIDTACGVNWTCGANWAIAAGQADHTAGSTAKFSQTITFTVGVTYNVTYSVIGGASPAGTITASIGGASGAATATPTSSTSIVSESIIAGGSNSLLEFTPSSDFNGSIDEIYVSITDSWDLYRPCSSLDYDYENIVSQVRVDFGNTRTIGRGRDKIWYVGLKNLTRAQTESDYEEFFNSVSRGETFTLDPYRDTAGGSADNPVSVILVQNSDKIKRIGTNDLFTVNFSARVLP